MSELKQGYRITIKAKNDELTLAPYSPCRVLSGGLSGFDFPEVKERCYSSASGVGAFSVGGVIGARTMTVAFEIADRARVREFRDRIISMMNPEDRVTIYANLYGRVRMIEAFPSSMPQFDIPHLGAAAKVKLSFVAGVPFFTEGTEVALSLPETTPLLSFPINFIKNAGTVCSFVTGKYFTRVRNPGDVECGFSARIRAAYGEVKNPYVRINGKYLKLNETVPVGGNVVFDTVPGRRRVTVGGINRYCIDLKSSFLMIPTGINTFEVSADEGKENLTVQLLFTPLYLGV